MTKTPDIQEIEKTLSAELQEVINEEFSPLDNDFDGEYLKDEIRRSSKSSKFILAQGTTAPTNGFIAFDKIIPTTKNFRMTVSTHEQPNMDDLIEYMNADLDFFDKAVATFDEALESYVEFQTSPELAIELVAVNVHSAMKINAQTFAPVFSVIAQLKIRVYTK